MDLLKKVQEKFPDHKITVDTVFSKDFKPSKVFLVDGVQADYKFNTELAQDLAAYELPLFVEDFLVRGICDEITRLLDERKK